MSFQILSEFNKTSRKYNISRKGITFKLKDIPANVNDPEKWVKQGIRDILKYILQNTASSDKIGLAFSSGLFSRGDVYMSFKKAADVCFDDVWELLGKIYQSNADSFSSDTFTLSATIAKGIGDSKPRPSCSQALNC